MFYTRKKNNNNKNNKSIRTYKQQKLLTLNTMESFIILLIARTARRACPYRHISCVFTSQVLPRDHPSRDHGCGSDAGPAFASIRAFHGSRVSKGAKDKLADNPWIALCALTTDHLVCSQVQSKDKLQVSGIAGVYKLAGVYKPRKDKPYILYRTVPLYLGINYRSQV